jgi:hypothetical protein
VRGLLLSLYRVQVSDGEIAAILKAKQRDWAEAAQQLKADIQASPVVHLDETPWPIQDQGGKGYAWAMSDARSPKVYFALEGSREGRHAQELLGETFTGVRISDDYAPYRSLPGEQQLCWAHLYRAGRDLRYNANLPPSQLPFVTEWYEGFSAIYQDLKQCLAQPSVAPTGSPILIYSGAQQRSTRRSCGPSSKRCVPAPFLRLVSLPSSPGSRPRLPALDRPSCSPA